MKVTVLNPVDANGNRQVDDLATVANSRTGNVFGYDRSTPDNLCTIPVRVKVYPEPNPPELVGILTGNFTVRLTPVSNASFTSALSWDHATATDPSVGDLRYVSGEWQATATFTGLPGVPVPEGSDEPYGHVPAGLHDLLHGRRTAAVRAVMPDGKGGTVNWAEGSASYEVYFGDSLLIDGVPLVDTVRNHVLYIKDLAGDPEDPIRREMFEKMSCSTEQFTFASGPPTDYILKVKQNYDMRTKAIALMTAAGTAGGLDLGYYQSPATPPRIGDPYTFPGGGAYWVPRDPASQWKPKFDQRAGTPAWDAVWDIVPFRGECLGAIHLIYYRAAAETLLASAFNGLHSPGSLRVPDDILANASIDTHRVPVFRSDTYDDWNNNGVWDHMSLFDTGSPMEQLVHDRNNNNSYDERIVCQGKDDRTIVPGDYCYFKNRDNYRYCHPDGSWQGENCVYAGQGGFVGLGFAGDEAALRAEMKKQYNEGLPEQADLFVQANDTNGNGRWDPGEPIQADHADGVQGRWDPAKMTDEEAKQHCRLTDLWRIRPGN
jgi:hypothetical protein